MHSFLRLVLLACLLALSGAQAVAQAQASADVGRVVFASGPAQLVAADGSRRPVAGGMPVRQGEQVITGLDGYVHLRMADNAFVAVRPDSRLAIELYEYEPERPAASRIRLQLHGGNARTVSGKGGESAKQNYRFNTPVAAIGLRGTDYTVTSAGNATRVSVARGAVAVAPLGEGCSSAGLGPCATPLTLELQASVRHAYMEVSAQGMLPVLVRPEQDPQGGGRQNPPARPAEPRADSSELEVPATKEVAGQLAADRVVASLPEFQFEFIWGRWSNYAQGSGSPPMASLLGLGREILVGNEVFGLLRTARDGVGLPTEGKVDFNLSASEAYSQTAGVLTAAQVSEGSFSVDFSRRSFATTLVVQHVGGEEKLRARGSINFQGQLLPDARRSDMTLNGAVGSGATEAAYLFDKPIVGGGLLGAVRWVR